MSEALIATTPASRVVYVTFKVPKGYFKRRSRWAIPLTCTICGRTFYGRQKTVRHETGRRYLHKFCSRSCYLESIKRKPESPKEEIA